MSSIDQPAVFCWWVRNYNGMAVWLKAWHPEPEGPAGASFEGGWGEGPSPPRKKKKRKKKEKKEEKRRKKKERKKGTSMNNVKLLHNIIKCCFFQFFNSPVALKDKKKFSPQEKVEMTPLGPWFKSRDYWLILDNDINYLHTLLLLCLHYSKSSINWLSCSISASGLRVLKTSDVSL